MHVKSHGPIVAGIAHGWTLNNLHQGKTSEYICANIYDVKKNEGDFKAIYWE